MNSQPAKGSTLFLLGPEKRRGPRRAQSNGGREERGKYLLKRLLEICKTIFAGVRAKWSTIPGHSCQGLCSWDKARKTQHVVVHSYHENSAPFRRQSFPPGRTFRMERDRAGIPEALVGER